MSKIYLSLIFCGFIYGVNSQTYQVTVSNEPFIYLENAQSAVQGPWDIPEFQLPLGFNFDFFNITTDQIYSIPNSFGADFEMNQDTAHLYTLFPFLASLIDRGYQQDSALSPINYKTEGTAGQRVFTLEFIEAGLFDGLESKDGVFLDYINFQVRLYEGSGDIEFHIGPYSIQEDPEIVFSSNIFCSVPGPLIGLLADGESHPGGHIGELILLSGDPVNPTIVTDVPVCLDWPIPENTVYRFSRMMSNVSEDQRYAKQPMFFPNPSTGKFTISSEHSLGDIEIFNFLGERVYAVKNVDGKFSSEINLSGYPKGMYLVVVKDGTTIAKKKVLIQ